MSTQALIASDSAAETPTREDVRACYRYILGREPEDPAVIDRHLAQARSLRELRLRFLNSEEGRRQLAPAPGVAGAPVSACLPLAPVPMQVEVTAAPDQLAAMLDRIGGYWARIGDQAPHWSVLTDERYRPERIAENRDRFFATGLEDRNLVRDLLARHGLGPGQLRRCVEFGCGVGRATLGLAELFPRVVGCDISVPHLALARAEAAARGRTNVGWHQSSMAAPMPAGRWQVWYSRLVLQHNPPPVMAHLLRLAFAGLVPGGIAIFQVPTYRPNYRFSVADYLARPDAPVMEMHALPQEAVFALAAEARLQVLEVREDTHLTISRAGDQLSNLFVLRRPPRPAGAGLAPAAVDAAPG